MVYFAKLTRESRSNGGQLAKLDITAKATAAWENCCQTIMLGCGSSKLTTSKHNNIEGIGEQLVANSE